MSGRGAVRDNTERKVERKEDDRQVEEGSETELVRELLKGARGVLESGLGKIERLCCYESSCKGN